MGKICLVIFVLGAFFFSSFTHPSVAQQAAKIRVVTTTEALDSIRIFSYNPITFEKTSLAEAAFDSLGEAQLSLEVPKHLMTYFEAANAGQPFSYGGQLYLEGDYNLTLRLADSYSFSGKGSQVNNYLADAVRHRLSFGGTGEKHYSRLSYDEFWENIDSLGLTLADLPKKHYRDSLDLDESVLSWLAAKDKSTLYELSTVYSYYKQLQQDGLHLGAIRDRKLQDFISHHMLLDLQLVSYGLASDLFLRSEVFSPIMDSTSEETEEVPVLAARTIQMKSYPPKIREFLLLKNLSYWADMGGLTVEIDSMYNRYVERFSELDVETVLTGRFQTFNSFRPGMEAPNILGTLPDGSSFELEELRGKTVLVDVWATWCGPCRRESPYLGKIKTEFSANDNIVFLNVSLDKNVDTWTNYIAKDGGMKGINIINDGSIYQEYQISGVPRYILIDKHGKIINYNAESPSSGKLSQQIIECIDQ